MLAFITYLLCVATVRRAYTRSLEDELMARTNVHLEVEGVRLHGPAFLRLTAPLSRGGKPPKLTGFLWPLIYLSVYGATTGITVVSLVLTQPGWLRGCATALYIACGLAITRVAYEAAFRREALVRRLALSSQI
jgi:hypothetical protein